MFDNMHNVKTSFPWFLQESDWELGNFITATPALRALAEKLGHSIPVYFETRYVSELYLKCPFILILRNRPDSMPFGDSKSPRSILRRSDDSDSEAHYRVIMQRPPALMFNGYVDDCRVSVSSQPPRTVAMIMGCHADHLRKKKTIDAEVLSEIIDLLELANLRIAIIGTHKDMEFWKDVAMSTAVIHVGYDIRESVQRLQDCVGFISNDTGMAHVGAGSPWLKGLVLWKETDFRSRSHSAAVTHIINRTGNYSTYIELTKQWIQTLVATIPQ